MIAERAVGGYRSKVLQPLSSVVCPLSLLLGDWEIGSLGGDYKNPPILQDSETPSSESN